MGSTVSEKKRSQIGKSVARFFGSCLGIFGLLVVAFGMPKYGIPFILAGAVTIYAPTEDFRSRLERLLSGRRRRFR